MAIEVSGTFGSRQEEAQRLGRILRPKTDGETAHFFTLVTRDTRELDFAHNRQRFLTECGGLAAQRLERDGLGEAIVFGPARDAESFAAGFNSSRAKLSPGGDADLISVPRGQLTEVVAEVVDRLDEERDRAVVERALGEAKGGSRGAAGLQETREALAEGRVDHLVFGSVLGEEAESLIRAALPR